MDLSALLALAGLPLHETAVLFHVAEQPAQNRALPFLAEEEPALFEAYQDQHGPAVEATLMKRSFVASFVTLDRGDYGFVGLFRITDRVFRTNAELDREPSRIDLRERYGIPTFADQGARTGQDGRVVFTLTPRPEMADLRGRLVVRKPAGARSYRFLAENLSAPVVEICRTPRLAPPPPDWQNVILRGREVLRLPRDWALRLSGWRGVYLITDESDGARYVGSAYGADNILGRWKGHVEKDQGVTVELSARNPAQFRFSILQIVVHDAPATEVVALEGNWKDRLGTREWGLNRN